MDRIPNDIHMVYGLSPNFGWDAYDRYDGILDRTIPRAAADPFNLTRYLTVKSAWDVNKPDNIYFYYVHKPYGELWEKVQKYITPIQIEKPEYVFDTPTEGIAYATLCDFIRLQILYENGGIYLDSDVLCLKPLNKFRNIEGSKGGCVIGQEGAAWEQEGKLTNAILLAEKDSEFVENWLMSFKGFDNTWAKWGVQLPFRLYKMYPDLLTVVDYKRFTWPLYHRDAMYWFYRGRGWNDTNDIICSIGGDLRANETLEESYCIHMWMGKSATNEFYKDFPDNPMDDWMTVDRIREVDTPFNKLARKFLEDFDE